ncbi:MAG: hypothetical protein AAB257_00905 [Nitrospinota bacterium]
MAIVIPVDIFELLEKKMGREEAKEVVKVIEATLTTIEKKAGDVALQKKLEIKDELTKELVTKAEFFGEIKSLRQEIQTVKIELEGKIELVKADVDKVNMKLNFLIVLMIIALTLMNPVMAEVIKGFLK